VFFRRHKRAARELDFWVSQVRDNSYFVKGHDLEKIGIRPGLEMGRRLDRAFQLSVDLQLKDKEQILKALLDEKKSL